MNRRRCTFRSIERDTPLGVQLAFILGLTAAAVVLATTLAIGVTS